MFKQRTIFHFKEIITMKYWSITGLIISMSLTFSAYAWNSAAHLVNWVEYENSGLIRFSLYENGSSSELFACHSDGRTKLIIESCDSTNNQCIAAVNRMASTLLAARLAGETVHVHNEGCIVTKVALAN